MNYVYTPFGWADSQSQSAPKNSKRCMLYWMWRWHMWARSYLLVKMCRSVSFKKKLQKSCLNENSNKNLTTCMLLPFLYRLQAVYHNQNFIEYFECLNWPTYYYAFIVSLVLVALLTSQLVLLVHKRSIHCHHHSNLPSHYKLLSPFSSSFLLLTSMFSHLPSSLLPFTHIHHCFLFHHHLACTHTIERWICLFAVMRAITQEEVRKVDWLTSLFSEMKDVCITHTQKNKDK